MTEGKGQALVPVEGKDREGKDRLEENLLALAKTPEERAQAYAMAARVRRDRMVRRAATAILEQTSWGRLLSEHARAAIARYAMETGTDSVRHWMVLGNKLYDTAELWFDLVSSQPDYAGYDHVDLSWTDGLSEEQKRIRKERRAEEGLPQDVMGAAVVLIYRTGFERPFKGVNHAGNRRCYLANQKRVGEKLDPIGEQDPSKTAFTRAFRRAAKTAWPIWPYKQDIPSESDGIVVETLPPGTVERLEGKAAVEDVLDQGREAVKADPARPITPIEDTGYDERHPVDPVAELRRLMAHEALASDRPQLERFLEEDRAPDEVEELIARAHDKISQYEDLR